ncbi:hypothetical protein [Leclercia sp.]|nr:hypothetical protein [Leclercia sp.]
MEEQKYTIEFTEGELNEIMDSIEATWNDGHDTEGLSSAADKITYALNFE